MDDASNMKKLLVQARYKAQEYICEQIAAKMYAAQVALLTKADGLYPTVDDIPNWLLDKDWEHNCEVRCDSIGKTTSVGRNIQAVLANLENSGNNLFNEGAPDSDNHYKGTWAKCHLSLTCGLGTQVGDEKDMHVRALPYVDITWSSMKHAGKLGCSLGSEFATYYKNEQRLLRNLWGPSAQSSGNYSMYNNNARNALYHLMQ